MGLPNEVRLPRIIGIARHLQLHTPFNFPFLLFLFLWWRRWWPTFCAIHLSIFVLRLFKNGKPHFLVPFWVLTAALDRLCSSRLAIMFYGTIGILLANVPFIGEVFL